MQLNGNTLLWNKAINVATLEPRSCYNVYPTRKDNSFVRLMLENSVRSSINELAEVIGFH